jgi:hypothetical protein
VRFLIFNYLFLTLKIKKEIKLFSYKTPLKFQNVGGILKNLPSYEMSCKPRRKHITKSNKTLTINENTR